MSFIYKDGTYYSKSESGGSGLPDGGTTGQILAKHSNTDQDVEWKDEVSYSGGNGINIDANNEISTDNMPASDMSEVVTPLPSVMSRMPILFDEMSEERVVGWYRLANGTKKPVYEKTLDCGTLPNNNHKDVSYNSSNVEHIISVQGIGFASSGIDSVPIPYDTGNGSQSGIGVYAHETYVRIITTRDFSTYNNSYVTIRYTKTTDTPA